MLFTCNRDDDKVPRPPTHFALPELNLRLFLRLALIGDTGRRIAPIHASTDSASSRTSQAASVGFPRSSPSRTQATAGELDNLSQPTGEGRGGANHTHKSCREDTTQAREKKGQLFKVALVHPAGTVHDTVAPPSAQLNFGPSSRCHTAVRPSNVEMGAVTLQAAPGNPTLQLQRSAVRQRAGNPPFICFSTPQTSAADVAVAGNPSRST